MMVRDTTTSSVIVSVWLIDWRRSMYHSSFGCEAFLDSSKWCTVPLWAQRTTGFLTHFANGLFKYNLFRCPNVNGMMFLATSFTHVGCRI